MSIIDTIYSFLPAKKRHTPSGWTKFNAVCCHHNGTTPDKRSRAGIIRQADTVSYHCFNCGYKASYQAGRPLTRKMKQLLSWLGAPDDIINKLAFESLKIEADLKELEAVTIPTFPDIVLPEDSIKLSAETVSDATIPAIQYIYDRGMTIDDYDFYVSPTEFADRILIPFYYEKRLVGYTARKLTDGKPKYISKQTPGYVFNLDNQAWDSKYVVVVEGPWDALAIGGVAILGADIMDKQALLINKLQRQVIVVPDRDKDGMRTVSRALELGWSVSMPDWDDGIKDSSEALLRYGKMFTLHSILNSVETYSLKIQIKAKTWFDKEKK